MDRIFRRLVDRRGVVKEVETWKDVVSREMTSYIVHVGGVYDLIENCRVGLWKIWKSKRMKGEGGTRRRLKSFHMSYINAEVLFVRAEDGTGRRENVRCWKQYFLLLMKRIKKRRKLCEKREDTQTGQRKMERQQRKRHRLGREKQKKIIWRLKSLS